MFRFYRQHYAPARPWPLNLLVYAGIGVKLAASAMTSALRRLTARLRAAGLSTRRSP
jgi:hypothetical protein